MGALDHTVYLQRLAKGGATYINIGGVDPAPTNIMKDAHRMGLTKNIQFVNSQFWGPFKPVGIRMHPEVVENLVISSYYLRGSEAEKHPDAQLFKKNHPDKSFSEFFHGGYFIGVALARDIEAGLKIALKKVGYEKLDGEVLGEAYKQLTGSTHRGSAFPPCAYSPTNSRASREVKFYRIQKGDLVPISDWIKAPDAVSMHKWK